MCLRSFVPSTLKDEAVLNTMLWLFRFVCCVCFPQRGRERRVQHPLFPGVLKHTLYENVQHPDQQLKSCSNPTLPLFNPGGNRSQEPACVPTVFLVPVHMCSRGYCHQSVDVYISPQNFLLTLPINPIGGSLQPTRTTGSYGSCPWWCTYQGVYTICIQSVMWEEIMCRNRGSSGRGSQKSSKGGIIQENLSRSDTIGINKVCRNVVLT